MKSTTSGCRRKGEIPRYRKDPLMTVCGKRGFASEQEAGTEVRRCQRKHAGGLAHRREATVYSCLRCWRWHMTSQADDGTEGART